MMCERKTLDRTEAVEDSLGDLNSFVRKNQILWGIKADLEEPGLNCWAAEDMLRRQLNIRAVWAVI